MTTESPQRKPVLTLVTTVPAASQTNTTTDGKSTKALTWRKARVISASAEGDYPLRAILDIEVSWVSKRTIEQVCHLDTPDAELTTQQRRERRLLGDFGLDVAPAIGALQAGVVLVDKRWFKKQRPELKHLANLLEKSSGVVPYTPGLPRISDERVAPNALIQSGTPMLAILKAKLTPELTVEDACHMDAPYSDEFDGITGEVIREHFMLLRHAGLRSSVNIIGRPDAIVLEDEKAFAATFPKLAHLIPRLIEAEGVQPYTRGLPRVFKTGSAAPAPRPRPTHLSLVPIE